MKSRIPHISTRGYYDLHTGVPLRTGARYSVFPRQYFAMRTPPREIAIMVHGMRNDRAGAAKKFAIAQRRLRTLGYTFPVIGYTYDADVRGAHTVKTARRALKTACTIASRNGRHLAMAVNDIKDMWPSTRIRLIGHSLGSVVIAAALRKLAQGRHPHAVESVHLFGASLSLRDATSPLARRAFRLAVRGRVLNHYFPGDDVLQESDDDESQARSPLGLRGIISQRARPPHYAQRRVHPRNHRFASYAAVLRSFP